MKKTFRDLRPGDKIWWAYPDSFAKNHPITVSRIDVDSDFHEIRFFFKSNNECVFFKKPKMEHLDSESIKVEIGRGSYFFFCNEADCERYRKAQGMKELLRKIEAAKAAVESVKQFRQDNFADLNKNWLESEIIKLEKQTQ